MQYITHTSKPIDPINIKTVDCVFPHLFLLPYDFYGQMQSFIILNEIMSP